MLYITLLYITLLYITTKHHKEDSKSVFTKTGKELVSPPGRHMCSRGRLDEQVLHSSSFIVVRRPAELNGLAFVTKELRVVKRFFLAKNGNVPRGTNEIRCWRGIAGAKKKKKKKIRKMKKGIDRLHAVVVKCLHNHKTKINKRKHNDN